MLVKGATEGMLDHPVMFIYTLCFLKAAQFVRVRGYNIFVKRFPAVFTFPGFLGAHNLQLVN